MFEKIQKRIGELSFTNLFGLPQVALGRPLMKNDWEETLAYFEQIYPKCEKPIEIIVKRFGLENARILSVASGVGAEEIWFAKHDNLVECIEPDPTAVSVCRHFIQKLGVDPNKITIHQTTTRDFESQNKFHFIYSSSPTDWMNSDWRQAIPNHYIDFFNRFSDSKCVVFIRLYGSKYRKYILSSSWLPKAIAAKLAKFSNFRLREYWLASHGRYSAFIAANFNGPLPVPDGFGAFTQRGAVDSFLKVKYTQNEPVKFFVIDRLSPYLIVGKHLMRRIVRKVTGVDVLLNY